VVLVECILKMKRISNRDGHFINMFESYSSKADGLRVISSKRKLTSRFTDIAEPSQPPNKKKPSKNLNLVKKITFEENRSLLVVYLNANKDFKQ
jgi:hypothetical protein